MGKGNQLLLRDRSLTCSKLKIQKRHIQCMEDWTEWVTVFWASFLGLLHAAIHCIVNFIQAGIMTRPLQRDHHLTVVEWFVCLNDPKSNVVWSLWLLVGPLMPNRSKGYQTKCGPLVLWVGGLGWGLITLSHKTLLLQKPEANKIHFIKGTLWPVLTTGGSEDRCSKPR